MRPTKYVKIITSQLEQFEDMKKHLKNLLKDIKRIIYQGQSWIDETGNELSFAQINQLLASELSNCIQKCLNITLEEENINYSTKVNLPYPSSKISSPSSVGNTQRYRDFNEIQIKLDEFDKRISEQSTKLKSLNQKVKRQEIQNETSSSQLTDKNTEVKFQEITKELHAASDFMSYLQSKTEMLTNEQNEHEKKLNGVIKKFTNQEERIKVLTTNQESDAVVKEMISNRVMTLKGDVDIVKSNLDSLKSSFTKTSRKFNELSESLNETKLNNKKSISFSVALKAKTVVEEGCVVKYDKIFTNTADGYKVSTGIFTCHVEGHYLFQINLTTECEYVTLALFQNKEHKISVDSHTPYSGSSGGNSVVLHLKLYDKVFLKAQSVSALSGNVLEINSTFSGFLLAAD